MDLRPPVGGTAVLAGPGGRVLVEDAAGGEPDQDVRGAAGQPVGEGGGAVAGVEDEQRHRPAGPDRRRRSTLLTWAIVCAVRVAGVVRCTSMTAAQAVRRWPVTAASWYSQPGVVLLEPLQWQAPWWTCSRPGEHHAPGRG